ncbi:MAG: hypothetical protein ACLU30_10185, partial [Odoribacter splanchnicus]
KDFQSFALPTELCHQRFIACAMVELLLECANKMQRKNENIFIVVNYREIFFLSINNLLYICVDRRILVLCFCN